MISTVFIALNPLELSSVLAMTMLNLQAKCTNRHVAIMIIVIVYLSPSAIQGSPRRRSVDKQEKSIISWVGIEVTNIYFHCLARLMVVCLCKLWRAQREPMSWTSQLSSGELDGFSEDLQVVEGLSELWHGCSWWDLRLKKMMIVLISKLWRYWRGDSRENIQVNCWGSICKFYMFTGFRKFFHAKISLKLLQYFQTTMLCVRSFRLRAYLRM